MKLYFFGLLIILFSLTAYCQDTLKGDAPLFFSIEGCASDNSDQNIFKYMAYNLVYPQYAKDNCITGRVFIEFTIDSLGNVVGDSLLNKSNKLLVAESKRVFYNTSGYWRPATKDGFATISKIIIPFNFMLRGGGCTTGADYFSYGLTYFKKENYSKAATNFRLALKQEPYNTDYLYNLSVSFIKDFKIDSACYYLNTPFIQDEELKEMKNKFCE